MTIFEFDCYREFLSHWLQTKKKRNPNYSQRAFAKFLNLGQPRLSEILNRKGHLSASNIQRVAEKLFDTTQEKEYFVHLRELALSQSNSEAIRIKTYLSQLRVEQLFKQIDLDENEVSEWYDFAILYILQMNPAIPITALAQYLDLSDNVAQETILRLQRTGALLPGTWTISPQFQRLKSADNSKSNATFHRSMISKSLDAMYRYGSDERDFQSYLFTMKQEDFEKLVKIVKDFAFSATDHGEAKNHNSLFCLSYQLFPIAKNVGHLVARCDQ